MKLGDGTVDLVDMDITTLQHGEFLDRGQVEVVDLSDNELAVLPTNVFDGLDASLTTLALQDNRLATIPTVVFDDLTGLNELDLAGNSLLTLPTRIFEKLTGLRILGLANNPGAASFKPIAMAGPSEGIEVAQGDTVTLGVEGIENGFGDPWVLQRLAQLADNANDRRGRGDLRTGERHGLTASGIHRP